MTRTGLYSLACFALHFSGFACGRLAGIDTWDSQVAGLIFAGLALGVAVILCRDVRQLGRDAKRTDIVLQLILDDDLPRDPHYAAENAAWLANGFCTAFEAASRAEDWDRMAYLIDRADRIVFDNWFDHHDDDSDDLPPLFPNQQIKE